MSTTPPVRSPVYREYTALLRQLHALIRDGQGDSPEADEIRDAMDGPGDRLDETEAELVGVLSADLYTLGSDGSRKSPEPTGASVEIINTLFSERSWIETLAWARSEACTFSAAEAASLRATLWNNEFKDRDSAILFAEDAARIAPNEWKYTLELARLLVFSRSSFGASKLIVGFGSRNPDSVPADILQLAKNCVASSERWIETRKALKAAEETARASTLRAQESSAALEAARLAEDRKRIRRMLRKVRADFRGSKAALRRLVPVATA